VIGRGISGGRAPYRNAKGKKEGVMEMKRSKTIIRGILICALVVLPLFSTYAAEKQLPTGAPSKIIIQPPQATKQIKLLPDLIVERVWLDDEGFINFQLKNAGQGEIPDKEHRQGMVRVTFGNKYEDFSFTRSVKTRPAVDPKGLLKKPKGVVLYNTGIKVKERLTIKVVVDSLVKIAEANDQNNQGMLLAPAVGALKAKGKEVQPVSPEVGREIAQKEKLKTLDGEGPEGGGGEEKPDLLISDLFIYGVPIPRDDGGYSMSWGYAATYIFNGGEEQEDIKFRVPVLNRGSRDFCGAIAITVYSITSPGPSPVGIITPVVTIPQLEGYFFDVILHQSEQIAQGKLSPGGRYEFKAKIKYFDGTVWKTATSSCWVTLTLTRPHPVVQAIPKAMTLTSEPNLTGTVFYEAGVSTENIEVGGGSFKRHGFISFDLTPLREKLEQWRSQGGRTFEIKSATLTLDEYDSDSYSGGILFDWLNYGTSLDPGDYMGPVYSNLYTFSSAPGIHTIEGLNTYVRDHLFVRNADRIQFRLRPLHQNDDFCVRFRKPCQLMVVIEAK
jgi:hypothetical protein